MMDDELRRRIAAQYGDGIPETVHRTNGIPSRVAPVPPVARAEPNAPRDKRGRTATDNRIAGRNAQRSGGGFESQLNDTHEGLNRDGHAHILPHYPPTLHVAKRLIYRKGGGPCDYSGHVNYGVDLHGDCHGLASVRDAADLQRRIASRTVLQIPFVFDAKVLGKTHTSYRHDTGQIGQIKSLELAARGGAFPFLLVRSDEIDRAFVVSFAAHRDELLRGLPIPLFVRARTGERAITPLHPSVAYTPGKGWLWPMAAFLALTLGNR